MSSQHNGRNWVQRRGGPVFATVMRLYPDGKLVIATTVNAPIWTGKR